jgi:hypothetical protein
MELVQLEADDPGRPGGQGHQQPGGPRGSSWLASGARAGIGLRTAPYADDGEDKAREEKGHRARVEDDVRPGGHQPPIQHEPGIGEKRDDGEPGQQRTCLRGASVVSAPIAFIAVGGLLGHAMYKRRAGREAEVRLRSDLQRYPQVVLRNIHAEVPPALQDGLERALRTVEQGISTRVGERRAELEAALAEHSANLASAEADLAPRREAARATLARLQDLAQRLAA